MRLDDLLGMGGQRKQAWNGNSKRATDWEVRRRLKELIAG
jgi:hypothetical protein